MKKSGCIFSYFKKRFYPATNPLPVFIVLFFIVIHFPAEIFAQTWQEINTGFNVDLNSVWCSSDNQTIWACGTNGTIIRSTDGGDTWTKLTTGTTQTLWDIIVLPNNVGAAVGNNGTVLFTQDGINWTADNSGVTDNLYGVTGYYSESGSGKIDQITSPSWGIFGGGSRYTIVAKTNQSSSWTKQLQNLGSTGYLGAMAYPYAFGDYGGLWKYENGKWNYYAPVPNMGDFMTGFVYGNNVWAAGSGPKGIHSSDNGATWSQINIGTSSSAFSGMYFPDANTGYVTGWAGEIRKTTDGGQTWPLQVSNTTKNLRRASGNNRGVYIAGSEGKIITNKTNGYTLSLRVMPPEAAAKGAKAIANPQKSVYNDGESVSLTATDGQDGWTFKQWTGDVTGTNRTVSLSMTGDKKNKEATANFVQPILTVSSPGPIRKVYGPEEAHDNFIKVMDLTLTANNVDSWKFLSVKIKNLLDKKSIRSAKIVYRFVPEGNTMEVDGDSWGVFNADTSQIQFNFSPALLVPGSGSVTFGLFYGIYLPEEDKFCGMKQMRTYRAEIGSGSDIEAIPLTYPDGLKLVYTPLTSSHRFVACVENSSAWGFNTIQEAIDSPLSGAADVLSVYRGTYNLTSTINVNKPHSIISKQGRDVTTLNIPQSAIGPIIDITSDNLSVEGFTINASSVYNQSGIGVSNSPKNIIIKNNRIRNAGYGIFGDSLSGTNVIENNDFEDCKDGLLLRWSSKVSVKSNQFNNYGTAVNLRFKSNNNTVINNKFKNVSQAFFLEQSCNNNEFSDNNIDSAKGSDVINLDRSSNNTFRRNTITSYSVNGILLHESNGNKFYSNTLTSANGVEGITAEKSDSNYFEDNNISKLGGSGIKLHDSNYNRVYSNTVHDSRVSGISVYKSDYNEIKNNTIYNSSDGIYFSGGRYNNFYGNKIYDNDRFGIEIYSPFEHTIQSNSIYQNGEVGIYSLDRGGDTKIINNTIYKNSSKFRNYGIGIQLEKFEGYIISNNRITDHPSYGLLGREAFDVTVKQNVFLRNCTGMEIGNATFFGMDVIIKDNIIKNSYCTSTGIHLNNLSAEIKNNDISNNNGYGILLENSSSASITSNNIYGNTGYAIGVASGSQVKNAENNYWGSGGPTSGMFQGNVTINSWLTNPLSLQVSPKDSVVYVTPGTNDSTEVYIRNFSTASDQVRLTITDEQGWLVNNNPVTVNVGDTLIVPVTIKFQIPVNTPAQLQNKVKLNAVSLTNQQIAAADSFYISNYISQLSKITISPDSISLTYGDSLQFNASGKDQHDKDFTGQLNLTWASTKGIINSNGLFTAGSTDELLNIIVTENQSGVKDSAHVSQLAKETPLKSLRVIPDSVEITTKERVSFFYESLDRYNHTAQSHGRWTATGGVIDSLGNFKGGTSLGHFTVTFTDTVRNQSASAHVWISTVTDVKENEIPTQYLLTQNYPNPFNPTTKINYSLPFESRVRMEVYNILGQRIELLIDDVLSVGNRVIEWNASRFASGVYLLRLTAEPTSTNIKPFTSVIKIVHLK